MPQSMNFPRTDSGSDSSDSESSIASDASAWRKQQAKKNHLATKLANKTKELADATNKDTTTEHPMTSETQSHKGKKRIYIDNNTQSIEDLSEGDVTTHNSHQTVESKWGIRQDGVLLQGFNVIPQAKRILEILEGRNSEKLKKPYILITNGGGYSEEERCRKLSGQLDVEIQISQLIQAHTIIHQMVEENPDDAVLVLGGTKDRVWKVAKGYCQSNLISVHVDNPASDIADANSADWSSILVHTGVYDHTAGPSEHTPISEAGNVEHAVKWALKKHGIEP
ncbi:hypothetical protein M422DRAFT_266377 [Sphaerobolus stellatus SS14]|uniref:Uncharacterized protein n=1 Tax=Sphaerobolus stellatus (strain SS14) TaxID=990650 RepID=A0A0C9V307_SPHS4|nr:hypothetical protein M422DRAFT_266377 [Sphaerobolus stellatus SS14]